MFSIGSLFFLELLVSVHLAAVFKEFTLKFILLAGFALISSLNAFAQSPSTTARFCEDRKDERFVKALTSDPFNLMAFANVGGIGNGGVCWWHSRYQRNALYLTSYKPKSPRPTRDEALLIIKKIREANETIVIPGFEDFYSFSKEYKNEIQAELEYWQKNDGIVHFAWIKGLSGDARVSASKFKQIMDEMYQEVEINKNIAFNKLQVPGITSHAWLVIHMEKLIGGYNLEILDSNSPVETKIYKYSEGDQELRYDFSWVEVEENNYVRKTQHLFNFTPYLERTEEMEQIKRTILKKCDPEKYDVLIKKEEAEKKAKKEKDRLEREESNN